MYFFTSSAKRSILIEYGSAAFSHQLRAASSLMKPISDKTSTTSSWMKSKSLRASFQGEPKESSKRVLNSSYLPLSVSLRSRSARKGIDPQKPCISLNTFRNTETMASLDCFPLVSPLESILNRTTSVGTFAASRISARTALSMIFLSSIK